MNCIRALFFNSWLVLTFAAPAAAFEIDSEYRSIPSQRGFEIIDPTLVDSEYQSDLLTYSISPRDYTRIFRPVDVDSTVVDARFFLSAGSLSATQFDFRLRGFFESELTPGLRFRFLRTENENYEEGASASVVELQKRLGDGPLWIAAYGHLARLKKEDDIGFALMTRTKTEGEFRVFLTFADFTRSERNDLGDSFAADKSPVVWGLSSRRDFGNRFSEFVFRREAPVQWMDAGAVQTYLYENWMLTSTSVIRHEKKPDDDSGREYWTSLRFMMDHKETTLANVRSVFRERQEFEFRIGQEEEGSKWSRELGISWMARHWWSEQGSRLTHQNLMPFVWFKHRDGYEAGWETTVFRLYGDRRLGSPTTRDHAEESRVNLRYRIKFATRGELVLALTFDADRAEGGAFEGGHGQFVFGL